MPIWRINNKIKMPLVLLAMVEIGILYSSIFVATEFLLGDLATSNALFGSLAPKALTATVILFASLIAMGLYQFHQRMTFTEAAVRVMVGFALGSLVLAAIYYAAPSLMISRQLDGLASVYAITLILLARFYFVRKVDTNIFRKRTLVFGAGDRASALHELRRRADRRGFKVVGEMAAPGDTIVGDRKELLGREKSLLALALEHDADEIVVAMDDRRGNFPIQELLDCKLRGIEVIDLVEFLERETGKIRIDLVHPGWLIFSPGFRMTKLRAFVKRALDLVVSVLVLFFGWPIMLLIAFAIKCEDGLRAPVLYRQERVGFHGERFSVLKFRSMQENAEVNGEEVWAQVDDDRVTRVGRIIRKLRLDELPQVLNVLGGQMSLVGPRPERPRFVEELKKSIPFYSERHAVKPGVTGWAQLNYSYGSSEEDALEKLQYDLYYVKNHNITLDLLIILQTAEVVLWGKGAR